MSDSFGRRSLLAGGAAAAGSLAFSGYALAKEGNADTDPPAKPGGAQVAGNERLGTAIIAFDGKHQAGIDSPHQAHLNLVAFNVKDGVSRQGVQNLMRLWTEDSRRLCTGEAPAGSLEPELETNPANLTITCGWGKSFFDKAGITAPEWLGDVRPFERDELDPRWGQTDIVLQICCDDPTTAAHTLRHLARAGSDYTEFVWLQQGFVNANGTLEKGATPRNLFGQVDGTVNPRTEKEYDNQVWIDGGNFADGSAMVVRRIAMNMDTWDEVDRASRETAIGRDLATGAPLSGGSEHDPIDLEARDKYGLRKIAPTSHVARSHHPEQKLLRRAYNYDVPPHDPASTIADSGLVFICFQKDPRKQFEPIQARLDEADQLNTWITHIGSAMYFIPRGTTSGGKGDAYWGQELLRG
ncbi:peroxidase [Corynebacterium phocae]|uniref:Peroxidase n=1 Tax=Corynebacterium phocae TaxID=161895 RepID=A0A1L7D3A4_9CORY|nr:Dyp-type peroxidase [Corynebacterium phocae]APT92412.1 peroxidase [Corynebacterium phocae]KAA8725007.1 Dyp-type peroxidase [Corynebacterium phocae]